MSYFASWLLSRYPDVGKGERLLGTVADDGEDLVFAQNHEVVAVDLDLTAGVLAHENLVALFDVHGRALAFIVELAGTDGDHFGLLRLLLGGVGNDDSTPDLLLGLETLDQNTIVQRT